MVGKAVLGVVLAISLGATGCAAQQRRSAGGVIGGISALTTITGLSIAAGCVPYDNDRDDWEGSYADHTSDSCDNDGLEPNPGVGMPVLTIGLTIAVIAGIVYATGVDHRPKPAAAPPAPVTTTPPF